MKKFIISIILIIVFITSLSIITLGDRDKSNNFNLKKDSISNHENEIKDEYDEEDLAMDVYITKKKSIDKIELEDYVKGVVSAEMPVEFPLEALKAQAVAARTYALAHKEIFGAGKSPRAHGGNVNDTTDFQVYMDKEERMRLWPKSKREKFWNKITQAVDETKGEVLSYDGELVMSPYYFSTSGGKTEDAINVFNKEIPYLKSVKSPGEEGASKYISRIKVSYDQLAYILNQWNPQCNIKSKSVKKQICILERSKSGTVLKMKVGDKFINGIKFRTILKLNSANFHIDFYKKQVEITCRGYGHGVGMSQWGSKAMAEDGCDYKKILKHYYNGTDIIKLKTRE
ncbi:stage II sporulation protein D [Clostridium botulinum]|uniref:Sporulation protein n=1 Tax=Clostridium botulinum TaxID=1491 RepID=A0A9Q1UW01_CLOBO|nr:stage II sporulation protein D [Clostridium botulinum]AEB76924.1 sporulation protein SpoIID [Clostridium botulinum BKT015925]KEH98358.1 sporulation protein [Clostridium botulinum D str. 16868]KEI05099.1 sporulation protein [Clostridium botulinum C/D str. Sp77]KLU75373.1 sporulation protein [Clostridium botulinum V891]KOA76229.1 sporulation protein [Clostridium botulinum]